MIIVSTSSRNSFSYTFKDPSHVWEKGVVMERGYHLGAPTPGPASFFALLGMVIVLTHFTGVTSIRPSMALLLS